jgi:hypothetical protein
MRIQDEVYISSSNILALLTCHSILIRTKERSVLVVKASVSSPCTIEHQVVPYTSFLCFERIWRLRSFWYRKPGLGRDGMVHLNGIVWTLTCVLQETSVSILHLLGDSRGRFT